MNRVLRNRQENVIKMYGSGLWYVLVLLQTSHVEIFQLSHSIQCICSYLNEMIDLQPFLAKFQLASSFSHC